MKKFCNFLSLSLSKKFCNIFILLKSFVTFSIILCVTKSFVTGEVGLYSR